MTEELRALRSDWRDTWVLLVVVTLWGVFTWFHIHTSIEVNHWPDDLATTVIVMMSVGQIVLYAGVFTRMRRTRRRLQEARREASQGRCLTPEEEQRLAEFRSLAQMHELIMRSEMRARKELEFVQRNMANDRHATSLLEDRYRRAAARAEESRAALLAAVEAGGGDHDAM